jgi:hypothetical protein
VPPTLYPRHLPRSKHHLHLQASHTALCYWVWVWGQWCSACTIQLLSLYHLADVATVLSSCSLTNPLRAHILLIPSSALFWCPALSGYTSFSSWHIPHPLSQFVLSQFAISFSDSFHGDKDLPDFSTVCNDDSRGFFTIQHTPSPVTDVDLTVQYIYFLLVNSSMSCTVSFHKQVSFQCPTSCQYAEYDSAVFLSALPSFVLLLPVS